MPTLFSVAGPIEYWETSEMRMGYYISTPCGDALRGSYVNPETKASWDRLINNVVERITNLATDKVKWIQHQDFVLPDVNSDYKVSNFSFSNSGEVLGFYFDGTNENRFAVFHHLKEGWTKAYRLDAGTNLSEVIIHVEDKITIVVLHFLEWKNQHNVLFEEKYSGVSLDFKALDKKSLKDDRYPPLSSFYFSAKNLADDPELSVEELKDILQESKTDSYLFEGISTQSQYLGSSYYLIKSDKGDFLVKPKYSPLLFSTILNRP